MLGDESFWLFLGEMSDKHARDPSHYSHRSREKAEKSDKKIIARIELYNIPHIDKEDKEKG